MKEKSTRRGGRKRIGYMRRIDVVGEYVEVKRGRKS